MPRKFPWRFAIYGIALLYVFLDLSVFHGPMYRHIQEEKAGAEREAFGDLAATVNAHPITEAELNEGIRTYCFLRGIKASQVTDTRREQIRSVVLNERIDDILVWMYARPDPVELPSGAVDEAVDRFKSQFQTEEDLEKRLKAQGMDEKRLRAWIEGQTQQRSWIESKIAKAIVVSDDDVAAYRKFYPESGKVPEILRASHIFLPTLGQDAAAVEGTLRAAHQRLMAGEITFEALAAELSGDARTGSKGGDLGYFARRRMPADFFDIVNALTVGETSPPFQTRLGWHIARLTERLPAREATPEEANPEIAALIETTRRESAVKQLVAEYRKRANIKTFIRPLKP
jgi:peptidyl-prolyl cis-trans isomerase C